MTPKQLLQECETLTYRGRMRRMAELGRLAASDTSIGQTIVALAQGDVFQRVLAVQSCFGSRDSALALRALSDPSRSVRTLAPDLVALVCSDDEVQTALDLLLPDLKLYFLRALSRRRRHAAIDRYIETLALRRGGVAIRALIATTRYQRDHLVDVLKLVRHLRNEQDPVRCEMLTALAELPHSIWHEEHLDDLTQIIRDALDATDLSHATVQAVERLIVYLFPFHPEWSAGQMVIVYRERGFFSFPGLDRYLSKADIRRIAPLLTPLLQSWHQQKSVGLLIPLANALGKRLRVFDEFFHILEITLEHPQHIGTANDILNLLLKYRKKHAAQLITSLLQQDKSWIVIPAVFTYLHHYRQDLLTPFLGQNDYQGKFSWGNNTPMVLPLNEGFFRWTPTQQEIFAQTLLETIDQQDRRGATYKYRSTTRRLAAMPAIDYAPLIQFASDTRQVLRDLVLQALGTLDAGQGIPALLHRLAQLFPVVSI